MLPDKSARLAKQFKKKNLAPFRPPLFVKLETVPPPPRLAPENAPLGEHGEKRQNSLEVENAFFGGDSAIFLICSSSPIPRSWHVRFDESASPDTIGRVAEKRFYESVRCPGRNRKVNFPLLLQLLRKCAGAIWSTTLLIHSWVGKGHSMAMSSRWMRKTTGVPTSGGCLKRRRPRPS